LVTGIKSIITEIDKARIASSQTHTVPNEQQNQNAPIVDQPVQAESQSIASNSYNVNNLGYFLDGWADLIEGMGEKTEEVRSKVVKELQGRNMPDIKISNPIAVASSLGNEKREYTITTTYPGATTAIYIACHGKDLYTSWRTFINPVLNWGTIILLAIIAGGLSLWWQGSGLRINTFDDYLYYFSEWFSFIEWIVGAILVFFVGSFMVSLAGRHLKGNSRAFFYIEPNLFDADDIAAMSLSAHKSILRALDTAGIDVTKLRLKQDFKGGRRDEMI